MPSIRTRTTRPATGDGVLRASRWHAVATGRGVAVWAGAARAGRLRQRQGLRQGERRQQQQSTVTSFRNTDARAAEIMQATFTKVRTLEGSMENLAGASRERPSVKVLTQQALLLLATCFASPTAAADDSANYFLEPCRAATTDARPSPALLSCRECAWGKLSVSPHCVCFARQA